MSSGDPATRERILKETWRLMAERRGRGVPIADIASAAGVSRQAVYLHFGSRTGLLVATARYIDEVKGVRERVQKYRTATSGLEALERFVEFWGNYIPEVYAMARALRDVQETDEAAAAAWNDRMGQVRQGCRMVIEWLDRDRLLAPEWSVESATDMLWTILSIAVWENLINECGWSTSEYVGRMITTLKRTFVNTGS
jgi:AcrR family transcriptional regulator